MIKAIKTYLVMLLGSFSNLNYYRHLPRLQRKDILIFFVVSYVLFGIYLAGRTAWRLNYDLEFSETYREMAAQQIDIYQLNVNLDQIMDYTQIAIFIIYPMLYLLTSIPMLAIETVIVYFAGKFESKRLKVWTAIALVVHINLIANILGEIMQLIYGETHGMLIYIAHWMIIIFLVWRGFEIPKLITKNKAVTK
ncbi:MAG: hypothetical protein LBG64_00695 [Pseudomonadales bacterium]|jgi:hypothetical protein|nr:hypothetical protein [Pseudomonadales bacterium]